MGTGVTASYIQPPGEGAAALLKKNLKTQSKTAVEINKR